VAGQLHERVAWIIGRQLSLLSRTLGVESGSMNDEVVVEANNFDFTREWRGGVRFDCEISILPCILKISQSTTGGVIRM
jgi:hypothetical protein